MDANTIVFCGCSLSLKRSLLLVVMNQAWGMESRLAMEPATATLRNASVRKKTLRVSPLNLRGLDCLTNTDGNVVKKKNAITVTTFSSHRDYMRWHVQDHHRHSAAPLLHRFHPSVLVLHPPVPQKLTQAPDCLCRDDFPKAGAGLPHQFPSKQPAPGFTGIHWNRHL